MPEFAEPLSDRYLAALSYAADLHRTQVRKGSSVPYLTHLMSVSSLVWEDGGDEDAAIAALLHDAVEDQGGLPVLEEIRSRFGERVASIVAACSDSGLSPDEVPGVKRPWLERKTEYLARLEEETDEAVLLVSAADKLHNCRSLLRSLRRSGPSAFEPFSAPPDGVVWYYRSCSLILARKFRSSASVLELSRVVPDLELYLPPSTE